MEFDSSTIYGISGGTVPVHSSDSVMLERLAYLSIKSYDALKAPDLFKSLKQ